MTQPICKYRTFFKNNRFVVGLWVALFASLQLACVEQGYDAGEAASHVPMRMTFLHTSDIHSRLLPYEIEPNSTERSLGLYSENMPIGGASRLAYLIKRERERSQRVMHVDSGDCFQGAPIFNRNAGEAELRFMSLLGPDAVVVGNHEFDNGVNAYVKQLSRWMGYANLAANYVFPDYKNPNNNQLGMYTQPFSVFNYDGLKIGVIGMANVSSLNSIGEGGNSLQLLPLEQNSALRSYVRFLRPVVDLVVVVSHLGLTEDVETITGYEHDVPKDRVQPEWKEVGPGRTAETVRVFIPGVPGVDIIFGGHLHTVLNPPKVVQDPTGRDTLVVHSGAFAKYIGRLDIVAEDDVPTTVVDAAGQSFQYQYKKRVAAYKYQVFPVDNRLREMEDPQTVELMEPYVLDLSRTYDLKRPIGYALHTIERNATGSDSVDSPLGNLVTESMRRRRRVEAEFSLTNSLGIRDNIYQGVVTLEQMFNIFPFENTITVMYMSGYDVQDLFDHTTRRSASRGCQPQGQIAGARFVQNCAQVLENQKNGGDLQSGPLYKSPAQNVMINGLPLVLTNTYKLATNDYIAKGGSGFEVLRRNTQKFDTGISLRDALIDYIQTLPTCAQYLKTSDVCSLTDNDSKNLCAELNKYADLPCIDAKQDGRIKPVYVLGSEQGQIEDDDTRME